MKKELIEGIWFIVIGYGFNIGMVKEFEMKFIEIVCLFF